MTEQTSTQGSHLGETGVVTALAAAFDRSFAEPLLRKDQRVIEVLIVRVGHRRYVVRRSDLALVSRCPPVTALPSAGNNDCLGLVRLRGRPVALLPVDDAKDVANGFVMMPAGRGDAALLVDHLEGVRRVPAEAFVTADGGRPMVRWDSALVPTLNLIAAVRGDASPPVERSSL